MGDYIGTYDSGQFWVDDPNIKDISFEEITHAISLNVRFNGHTNIFWSVAQHSLLVAEIASNIYNSKYVSTTDLSKDKLELLALTHDFSEAYMSDIVRPFKKQLANYLVYEDNVQNEIYKAIELDDISKYEEIVKEADTLALSVEANTLMNPCKQWLDDYEYMHDIRWCLYKNRIKTECPGIVQAKLLKKLFNLMNKLNYTNNYKNNLELMDLYNNSNDELPIISCGKHIADISKTENSYIIRYNGKNIYYTKNIVDNTLSIEALLPKE